jgi:ABC-2 type transport system permease protein
MTVLTPLMAKTARDDRRAVLGWAVGVAAFVSVYVGFYPQFQGAAELKENALPQGMADFLGIENMTSPAGYLEATVYSFIGPLLLVFCAITFAARAIPRPEEDGSIELLLANPLSRPAFAVQRLVTITAAVTGIAVIPWLLVTVLAAALDIDVPLGNISAASAGMVALVWCFTGLAFLVGAWTGRRSYVLGVAGTFAVTAYVMRALAGLVDGLGWLRWLSPFHYYIGADPLRTGWHPGHLAVLVAAGLVAAVAGIIIFDRRDVGV